MRNEHFISRPFAFIAVLTAGVHEHPQVLGAYFSKSSCASVMVLAHSHSMLEITCFVVALGFPNHGAAESQSMSYLLPVIELPTTRVSQAWRYSQGIPLF